MERIVQSVASAGLIASLIAAGTLSAAPSECVPAKSCQPPPLREFRAISRNYAHELTQEWLDQYAPMLFQRFSRSCQQHARCLAVWGNGADFCRDNLKNDLFAECDVMFDRATAQNDATSCRIFAGVFSLGQANAGKAIWEEAQACSRAKAQTAGPVTHLPQPRVVVEPLAPKPVEATNVIVRSFDAEGDPVMGLVTMAGVERGYTFIPMGFGFAFEKSYDDEGRATLIAPSVVVTAPPATPNGPRGFDPVTVVFETQPSTVRLEVTPPVGKWKKGVNKVRVVAFDLVTGAEVRGKLKTVGSILGPSGTSIEIRLAQGIHPCGAPIWFAADHAWYAEANLGVPPCAEPRVP